VQPNPMELLKSKLAISDLPYTHQMCLERIISDISQLTKITSVILFGSRARGTHRRDSDTDIMVVTEIQLEDSTIYESFNRHNRTYKADVSISMISQAEWDNPTYEESLEIKSDIESEGIKLYFN
jgi:predicted nucleotidyltransferase